MAKKPPARVRYERNHPVISIRVGRELYDELKELNKKTNKSFADFLREGAGLTRKQIIESTPTCYCCTDSDKVVVHLDYFIICKECYRDTPDEEIVVLMDAYFSEA